MWSPADLAILVPMLGRAHRVQPLLESIEAATPGCHVLFLTTPDDLAVTDAIDQAGAEWMQVPWRPVGDYARKINEGYRATSEPLLFTAADDLSFEPGWFEAATNELDDRAGVVGTWDKCNRRTKWNHSTHSLVTRWYADLGTIDEPQKIYHEGYVHEFVDDEMVQTALHRKAYRHCRKAVVAHLHPMAGFPSDLLYEQQGERMEASRDLFRQRRLLWA